MEEKIIQWVMDWFHANSKVELADIQAVMDLNYFEQGYVDSIKFIMMISDIEETFKIHFKNDEFQNRDFATVRGLTKIIEGKVASK